MRRVKSELPTRVIGSAIEFSVAPAVEGYYPEFDLWIPLIPETPLQPLETYSISSPTRVPAFIKGESLTANVQELTLVTAPVPSFRRGEVITEAVSGTTGIVARRYTDGRYLVYNNTGAMVWAGNAVTGSLGGGATTAAIVASEVTFRGKFDSHYNEPGRPTYSFIYNTNMVICPGAKVTGATSGVVITLDWVEQPDFIAELELFAVEVGANNANTDTFYRVGLLSGDCAEIAYDLGVLADAGQRRIDRGEMRWHKEFNISPVQTLYGGNTYNFLKTQIKGIWRNSQTSVGIPYSPFFLDSLCFRLYPVLTNEVGSDLGKLATRQLTYRMYKHVLQIS